MNEYLGKDSKYESFYQGQKTRDTNCTQADSSPFQNNLMTYTLRLSNQIKRNANKIWKDNENEPG